MTKAVSCCLFFFFNDTATTEIYTLSLHDALPICFSGAGQSLTALGWTPLVPARTIDRKSTRLNSSHLGISYAVFCLKNKKKQHYFGGDTTWINCMTRGDHTRSN